MNAFKGISFPVLCAGGVFADAATGKMLKIENGCFVPSSKVKKVKRATAVEYVTYTTAVVDNQILYAVYTADNVGKHGLEWDRVFAALFTLYDSAPAILTNKSEYDLSYWLSEAAGKENLVVPTYTCTATIEGILQLWGFDQYAIENEAYHSIREVLADWQNLQSKATFRPFKKLGFGVELEMTGITRCHAAKVIAGFFGTEHWHETDYYKSYKAKDRSGRIWSAMSDSSIRCFKKVNGSVVEASSLYSCEVVTPVLNYEDIEDLQNIVRRLRAAGGIVTEKCGIHVHVNAAGFSASRLSALAIFFADNEKLIRQAIAMRDCRSCYCELTNQEFLSAIKRNCPYTMERLADAWYAPFDYESRNRHYNSSRYVGLNLHSYFQGKGIEYRLFNSTLHAGKVKAYIQFCLALTWFGSTAVSHYGESTDQTSLKCMEALLKQLALTGDEFSTCRLHMTSSLRCDSSSSNTRRLAVSA